MFINKRKGEENHEKKYQKSNVLDTDYSYGIIAGCMFWRLFIRGQFFIRRRDVGSRRDDCIRLLIRKRNTGSKFRREG